MASICNYGVKIPLSLLIIPINEYLPHIDFTKMRSFKIICLFKNLKDYLLKDIIQKIVNDFMSELDQLETTMASAKEIWKLLKMK